MRLFERYSELAEQEKNVLFGGRLSEYRYYDMHQVIGSAMALAKRQLAPAHTAPQSNQARVLV
jgi:UDP-galactopyranose mutase